MQASLTPAPLKYRPGDQQLPSFNDFPFIQDSLIADIEKRKAVGVERYGTALQPFNGRDALRDAYEEAIDLATYLKQVLVERGDDLVSLSLERYQDEAATTAVYPDQGKVEGLYYCALGLAAEAGEIANKVKKIMRGDRPHIGGDRSKQPVEAVRSQGCRYSQGRRRRHPHPVYHSWV